MLVLWPHFAVSGCYLSDHRVVCCEQNWQGKSSIVCLNLQLSLTAHQINSSNITYFESAEQFASLTGTTAASVTVATGSSDSVQGEVLMSSEEGEELDERGAAYDLYSAFWNLQVSRRCCYDT